MILGRDVHVHSAAFDELNAAVEAMTDRIVCFNTHAFPEEIPPHAVVWNLENVPQQVDPSIWAGRECWDFNAKNAAKYGATHVPVGHHPSMERFARAAVLDIDVVFSGTLNDRRVRVLDGLRAKGLNVVHVPWGMYGAGRDALLARAKLALNMQYYEDGVWPALRVAHLVANRVPVLSEAHPDAWRYVDQCPYEKLISLAESLVRDIREDARTYDADVALQCFRNTPLVLPA